MLRAHCLRSRPLLLVVPALVLLLLPACGTDEGHGPRARYKKDARASMDRRDSLRKSIRTRMLGNMPNSTRPLMIGFMTILSSPPGIIRFRLFPLTLTRPLIAMFGDS